MGRQDSYQFHSRLFFIVFNMFGQPHFLSRKVPLSTWTALTSIFQNTLIQGKYIDDEGVSQMVRDYFPSLTICNQKQPNGISKIAKKYGGFNQLSQSLVNMVHCRNGDGAYFEPPLFPLQSIIKLPFLQKVRYLYDYLSKNFQKVLDILPHSFTCKKSLPLTMHVIVC